MAASAPVRYSEVVRHLTGAAGSYSVDDEKFTVTVAGNRVEVGDSPGTAVMPVRMRTTAVALISLADGTVNLAELLSSEDLIVYGNPDALLGVDAAVRAFALTVIESGRLIEMFEEYRAWAYRR